MGVAPHRQGVVQQHMHFTMFYRKSEESSGVWYLKIHLLAISYLSTLSKMTGWHQKTLPVLVLHGGAAKKSRPYESCM